MFVPECEKALREIRRVLKPTGAAAAPPPPSHEHGLDWHRRRKSPNWTWCLAGRAYVATWKAMPAISRLPLVIKEVTGAFGLPVPPLPRSPRFRPPRLPVWRLPLLLPPCGRSLPCDAAAMLHRRRSPVRFLLQGRPPLRCRSTRSGSLRRARLKRAPLACPRRPPLCTGRRGPAAML